MGYSLTPKDKAFNVLNYLIYFLIFWFSLVCCFLSYYFNKKLAKYVLDNWKTSITGLLTFSLTNAGRLFVTGALHSLLRNYS